MTEPDVRRHDDADVLVGDVASALLDRLESAQARGEVPQIGLTGGSIAEQLHRELARRADDSSVDWSRVVFWWGDERFVEPASDDRNERQAREAFLDAVDVDPAKVHPMPSTESAASVDEGAEAYGDELRSFGDGEFHVVMLGIGPDGHVASLFPGFPQLDVDDQIAVPVTGSPKPPPERISLTFAALNRSKAVWFLVSGEEKAPAVAQALAPGTDLHDIPAVGVTGELETIWFLDRASASAL